MSKLAILVYLMMFLPSHTFAAGFIGQESRYHGWLWFEEKAKESQKEPQKIQESSITPEEAKAEIEEFAKELENLKFMMLARPTVENVRNYREKEKQMWSKAEGLHDAWDMANLIYPEQRDLINNPVNVHAVKAKRELDYKENQRKIRELAKTFDLVLFFKGSCEYCKLISPVLKAFGDTYGFNIEAVSSDDTKHEYFRTVKNQELISRLGITAFPTVIAISDDGKIAFELIRGYVSSSELEEYAILAVKYIQKKEIE